MLLEQMTKVALIVEPGRQGNLRDRIFRFGQLARGPVETEPAYVLAHGCPVVFFERAREVRRVHSYRIRYLDKIEGIVETSVHELSGLH